MRKRLWLKIFGLLFFINLIFFNPVWLKGQIPFPGDLLLAEYGPWKNYSYFGYQPGAIPHKAQSFDTLRQLYPWRYLAIQIFKQGKWPLWNPYNFSGTPLLANFQTAAFYPFNLFYFIFPFNLAWAVQVMLQPFLASFFFFLFARRLKISFNGSLLGGIAFGYCSFMTVWLEYNTIGQVILWLPLALLAMEFLLESFSFFWASVLVASFLFSFFAGHPQDFLTLWLFAQIYLWLRILSLSFSDYGRRGLKIFLISFFPFFLGAIQLLPGLELIFHSARTPLPKSFLLEKVLLQPWQLILAFIPDFFGHPAARNYFLGDTYIGKVLYLGLLPLTFAILAIFAKKNFWIWFFFLSALVCLIFSLASPITGFLYSLPLFSSLSPTRILFIFQFSLAVLAGFGLDAFLTPRGIKKKKLISLGVISFVFLLAWILASGKLKFVGNNLLTNLQVVRRNLLYSTVLLLGTGGLLVGWLVKEKWRQALLVLMIVFTVVDLFRFFTKITPFCPPEFIFPPAEVFEVLRKKGWGRVWGYGTAAIGANYNLVDQLYSPEGYDPLYPRWYGEFIRSSEEGKIRPAIRSDAFINPGFGRTDFAENKARQKVLQALSVRFILDREENQTDQTTFPPGDFPLIWQNQGWRLYENQRAAPRAFFATKTYFANNPLDFEKIFFDPNFSATNEVILETKTEEMEGVFGEVLVTDCQPDRVKITTNSPQDELLVLTDTFYPGWQAWVDGKKVPVLKANYTLRAVFVPAGKHQVEFKYQPFSFRVGLIISSLSLGGWFLIGARFLFAEEA